VRQALISHELRLHFQPKVNMRRGEVVGFEALLRWKHPQNGMLAARDFLSLVEETDLIIDIGEWVMDQVLLQLDHWRQAGHDWPVSVNIAARHFQRADFVDRLESALARHARVAPQKLDLEIVESVAIENIQHVGDCLQACQALGVQFSLGDFGTGYSSLSYLKRLHTQTIKIDKSFVRDILHDGDDLALTTAVIGLARAFGRQVIAEGWKVSSTVNYCCAWGARWRRGISLPDRCRPPKCRVGWQGTLRRRNGGKWRPSAKVCHRYKTE
jgi:EAL domain-containing protein (putative c-di-GMP-specific phosphodiesterase class I)